MKLGAAQFVRAGTFLAGLALAAIAVAGWREPTHNASGAHLRVKAVGTSELKSSPAHPFLDTRNLEPGPAGSVSGRVGLTNTIAEPLAVRIEAATASPDLDRMVRVRASAGGKTFYDGTLGGLRTWSKGSFAVPSYGYTQLKTRFSLAPGQTDYRNREAEVTIEFKLAPGEGG